MPQNVGYQNYYGRSVNMDSRIGSSSRKVRLMVARQMAAQGRILRSAQNDGGSVVTLSAEKGLGLHEAQRFLRHYFVNDHQPGWGSR